MSSTRYQQRYMIMGYNNALMAMEGFVVCLVVSMEVLGAAAAIVVYPQTQPMYMFGDSILDVGNNNYLPGADVPRANKPYYGIDFSVMIPTGRFSNGYNTADYIAMSFGFVLSPPAYLSLTPNSSSSLLLDAALIAGVNYASGGAGILDSTNAGKCIPLSQQVEYFTRAKMVAAVGSREANARLSKSIFLISAGRNDLLVSSAEKQSDVAALLADLTSNYSATIEELYNMGARRLAIINLEKLGCLPAERVPNPAAACDGLNQLAAGFDDALRSLLAGLVSRLPGLVYSIGDYFRLTQDILHDPQACGYLSINIAEACCGSGRLRAEGDCLPKPNSTLCFSRSKHLFWDRVNPTQRTAFLTAQAFYDGPVKYTTPINFMQLAQ